MPDLGEQALNKVAEIGISSQLDEVENLDVEIQTDPIKLMSGAVDSVAVQGEGLVMQQDLRVEEMQLKTGKVAINPLSAAFGKIELQHPTEAEAHVVLTEADINRAFNSDYIREKMQASQITIDGKPMTVDTQHVNLGLPGDGKIALSADLKLRESGEVKRIAMITVPRVADNGYRVKLEEIQYMEGEGLSLELTHALLEKAGELLDLRNFELEGMSLRLKGLEAQKGRLVLQGQAAIEQFPST